MRNRAKCKLCGDIIESFLQNDFVTCKCGEISIDGGNYYLRCAARDWRNFIRIDDNGDEVIPKIVEKDQIEESESEISNKMSRKELLEMFRIMTDKLDELPRHVKQMSPTNADLYSFMLVLSQILEADE